MEGVPLPQLPVAKLNVPKHPLGQRQQQNLIEKGLSRGAAPSQDERLKSISAQLGVDAVVNEASIIVKRRYRPTSNLTEWT